MISAKEARVKSDKSTNPKKDMLKYIESEILKATKKGETSIKNPFLGYNKKQKPEDIAEVYKILENLGYNIDSYEQESGMDYTGLPNYITITTLSW